jgi:hypothetical protein
MGALGLLQTTWAGFDSNERCLDQSFNQFSAIILAAEYAWNSGKTSLDRLPYKPDEEFRRQWDPRREDQLVRRGFLLDLDRANNVKLADGAAHDGWLGLGPEHDLSSLPTGATRLGADLFRLAGKHDRPGAVRLASALDTGAAYPAQAELTVNRRAASLLFLHTALWTDRAGHAIGCYRVHYADGTSVEIPLVYGVNIVSWTDRRSISGAARVWEGRTRGDERIALHRLQWDNPHPEKAIASIDLVSNRTEAGLVLLAVSGLE